VGIEQIILLIINLLGGVAVIGSYVFGLNAQAGGVNSLWGGVPENIRPIYGISMIIAAIGYFAFIFHILVRLKPDDVLIAGRLGYWLFYVIFIGILLPSALWMPLTNIYVGNPGAMIWVGVRTVLTIVGLASIALVWALLTLNAKTPAISYWAAVVGSAYFAFHTAILDAIIWAHLFK
jgi:hypothetical protein